MDVVRPNIIVREKCACREDCGAEYELKVQLLKSNEEFDVNVTLPRFRTLTRSWNQWEGNTTSSSSFLDACQFVAFQAGNSGKRLSTSTRTTLVACESLQL